MNWDLTYLFPTVEEFEKACQETMEIIKKFPAYQGHLHEEEKFKEYFLLQKQVTKVGFRAYQYSSLKSDLNKKDQDSAANLQKIQIAFAMMQEACAFEEPELISIGKDKIMSFIDHHPELEETRFRFVKLFRRQEHILDNQSESLLANFNQLMGAGSELYSNLSVADIQNGDVMMDDGKLVTITNSNYRYHISKSKSPRERQEIFESVFSYYDVHKTTYAGIYNTVLQADYARMKARKYSSSVEASLFDNAIPVEVYQSLCAVARENTSAIKKYIQLRKKFLKLKEYHTYDRFLPLVKSKKEYEFDEAKKLFFKSIETFPADFQAKAREVLKEGFVDLLEAEGKRTGAYSSSVPDLHPFILLNYTKTLDDVFTVAHEAGHSMHSMYSMENQPTLLQDYTIFVAEVASTFNEHNLLDYFIGSSKASKNEKIALLQRTIDDILATFYRQTLFAIYEVEAHKLVESNQPITPDALSKIMIDLYKDFYDLDISKEPFKEFIWAYIPHLFYTPFYVYQYATSFATSLKLYENVKNKVPGAFDNYLSLLKSGGSEFPVEQVKKAGVDLTKKDAFLAVANRLSELVDQLEVEINK
jgi:oligoendopeptidase F